jgi:hypothetical protein
MVGIMKIMELELSVDSDSERRRIGDLPKKEGHAVTSTPKPIEVFQGRLHSSAITVSSCLKNRRVRD